MARLTIFGLLNDAHRSAFAASVSRSFAWWQAALIAMLEVPTIGMLASGSRNPRPMMQIVISDEMINTKSITGKLN